MKYAQKKWTQNRHRDWRKKTYQQLASRIVLNFYYKLIHFLRGTSRSRERKKQLIKSAICPKSLWNEVRYKSKIRNDGKKYGEKSWSVTTGEDCFFDHFEFGVRVSLICFIMCHAFETFIWFVFFQFVHKSIRFSFWLYCSLQPFSYMSLFQLCSDWVCVKIVIILKQQAKTEANAVPNELLMGERDEGENAIKTKHTHKPKFISSCRMFRFRDDFMWWSPCYSDRLYHSPSFSVVCLNCNYS